MVYVCALHCSFIGVVLVCLADNAQTDTSSPGHRPILGDFLAALSAVFYALYVLLLKVVGFKFIIKSKLNNTLCLTRYE